MRKNPRQSIHMLKVSVFVLTSAVAGGTLLGCRVSDSDVKRWGSTEHGPDKLVAVLTHEKYDMPLRIAAALELLEMKPRSGRRIGINRLVEALAQLGAEERKKLIEGMLPTLVTEMKKPVAPAVPGQPPPIDTSYAYKDAAIAMLTYDKAVLVTDDAPRKQLTEALIDWSQHDFDRRLTNTTQTFGMEQMMRAIGAPAVRGLPALIAGDASPYDRIASLVSELGDQPTKEATAQKLVELAKHVSSQAWIDKTKPGIDEANKASKITATADQLAKQIAQYQEESLTKVFAAMKKVGTRPAVDYCLSVAADKGQNEKRRQAALAALEGRLDRNNPGDIEKILSLAGAEDTPDAVRDLAFQRVGEMPREQVVGKLYPLFTSRKWKVRWVTAGTVLRMSNTAQLGEFMAKLPSGLASGFAMTEPLSYGQAIEKMQVVGSKPREAVLPFLKEGSLAARLTALGYFFANGKASDVPVVASFESDKTPTPRTDDPEAKWQCEVPKADGKENELKDIKDVGDFVKLCVVPAMKAR
ncbi:MAG TPA: hypothetical protein VJT73_01820 [Polyangiaceae bacterium]|nr:hypothetical protein [Polyangiaceae bacterium]